MKKWYVCLFLFILLTALTACRDKTPILKVVIQAEETDASEYMAVYPQGKSGKTEAFESDDAIFYTAAHGDFETGAGENTVLNSLNATTLIDENGNQSEADEVVAGMMQAAADSIEHSIWQFQAIVDGSRYFAFVKLNVNWQTPCILYEYRMATGSLTELCRWNDVDLVGIAIP